MTATARPYRGRPTSAEVRRPAIDGVRPADDEAGPSLARSSTLGRAIVEAVAYADVFDWPLTPEEIHRYLPIRASRRDVDEMLARPIMSRFLEGTDGYVSLVGRAHLVADRRRRVEISRALWPRALRYARLVAALPFVRLVAITGSLAVDAADDEGDVDLLVVTANGRLWLARAMSMAVVRAAALARIRLCPNYLLAESDLRLDDRSLFTAHELVQMVPVGASPAYAELIRQNRWFGEFLPNSELRPPLARGGVAGTDGIWRRLAEASLRSGIGDRLDRWEMRRKVRQLSRASTSAETRYDATCCKGHSEEHGRRSMSAFEARLRRLEESA
jgi:hypothetical protein